MRVTLVDDDEFLWSTLRTLFAERSITLDAIGDVDTAYQHLVKKKAPCDYLTCDVMMRPGKLFSPDQTAGGVTTGIELIKRVRSERKSLRATPTLAYSINSDKQIIGQLASMGVPLLPKTTALPRDLVAHVTSGLV